ncbi:MAG: hypothetical protein COA42_10985 [Alteromonadaceae bacterium]|nr:MAG: hypothetical protein COA42_10985 [Alteromonadaceae bacterium]
MRNFFKNTFLIFISTVVALFVAEGLFRLVMPAPEASIDIMSENLYDLEFDEKIGPVLKGSDLRRAKKYYIDDNGDEKIIYDVEYSTDQHRRRTVGHTVNPEGPHVLLFGGSFAYGEGLKDEDTLDNHLKELLPDINVFNYGVHGLGTVNMLRYIEARDLPNEVVSNKGVAIYEFAWFHPYRNIGSPRAIWTTSSPHYSKNSDGELEFSGVMNHARPALSVFNVLVSMLNGKSRIMTHLGLDTDTLFFDRYSLTAELVLKAKHEYESKFDGVFIVVVHPVTAVTMPAQDVVGVQRVISMLKEAGVVVIEGGVEVDRSKHAIPNDGHPTALFNREFAEFLVNGAALKSYLYP